MIRLSPIYWSKITIKIVLLIIPLGARSGGVVKLDLKGCSDDHPVRGTQVLYVCETVTNCDLDKSLVFLL